MNQFVFGPDWEGLTWVFFPVSGDLVRYCELFGSGRPDWNAGDE